MAVDVGSAVGYLDLDISGFLAGLRSAQSEADSATKNIATKIGSNLQSAGKSITSAGKTLTTHVTVPIVGLGTAAVKTTSDFESAMSKVSAISGATGSDLDALNQKAQEMGAKTKFSATESAEAFTYMAMAGWKTEDMLQGIDGIMALAAADGLDLATTSDIVTDALTAFGLSADDSGHFADVLAAAASNANTNVSLLGESFKYAAPVAGALGYSAEDTAIALGLMANAGIKGSQGGTALRSSLSRLIKPTDDAAALMEQYGLSMTNADGSMKSLGEVMEMLRTKMGGLSEAEQAQAAATLFGQEAMSGMLAVINASDSDYEKLTSAIYGADGAAQQMADTMLDNLSGQLTLFKSALEGLAIQFGEILMPYIKQFVQWLQNLVQKLQEMTPEQKEQIVKWAAFAAAIGPVLLAVGKLVTGIGNVISVFGKLKTAISAVKGALVAVKGAIAGISAPVVAVVAVIGTLVAAFATLWKTNEEFRNKITAIWNQIKGTFDKLCQGIVDRLNKLGFDFENIGEVLKAIWKGFCDFLAPIFEGVFQNIANTFDTIVNVILGILDFFIAIFTGDWEGAWDAIKGIFESIWNGIVAWFQNIGNTLLGILDAICGWFGTTWDNTWNSIKQFFVDIWNSIVSFFTNIIDTIKTSVSNFVTTIINFFAQLPTNIANFITNAWNSVVIWATNMVNKAREMGQNFLNAVVEFFTDLPYKIGYFIGSALTNVALWVVNMVNKAREMGQNFINSVVEFFTQLPGKILQFITSAWNNVTQWATNMVNKAREMGTNFINNVVSFFTQLPGKIQQFISSALNNVTTWVSNMASKAREAGSQFINNVVSFIQQLPGKIKQFLDSAINNLRTWVTQMGQKGKEAVQSLINNVISAASGIASKVMSIGSDIVSGVWNGIKNAASWFTNQVKGFFSGIVDGVKNALGIGSPSKVFRDEIGKWLPPGVAQGFKAALPAAMNSMEKDLNKGIDSIEPDDVSVTATATAIGFKDTIKSIYDDLVGYFESVEARIGRSVNNMAASLAMLIQQGQMMVNSDGTLGYVGYGGFTNNPNSDKYTERDDSGKPKSGDGDTFIFNSPKAIDEIEAARQMKKTKQDMAEGF